MNIADLIKQLSTDPTAEIFTRVAKVKEIDESKRTVDVEIVSGSADLFGCRLQSAIEGDKGIVIIPKKDSFVLVTFMDKNHAFVSATSEIEKVIVDFPELTGTVEEINIKDTEIVLNDGNNKGIVKVVELTQKLNALENLVNNILTALKSTTIPLAPSGSYPFAPLYAAMNNISPVTSQSDIENDKIKH